MFSKYDGSGRPPRQAQKDFLDWLESNWGKANVFVVKAPTSAGKSYIARAIQIAKNAAIITPSNALAAQYSNEYDMNVFAGKDNYISLEQYEISKERASIGVPTCFNPVSFHRLKEDFQDLSPECIILDEADQHLGMYYELVSERIEGGKIESEVPRSTPQALKWLKAEIKKLEGQNTNGKETKTAEKRYEKIRRYTQIFKKVISEESSYSVVVERDNDKYYFKFMPVKFPLEWIKRLFKDSKVIMMSGTLFDLDVTEFLGDSDFLEYEMPSPIPVENREVHFRFPPDIDDIMEYPVDHKRLGAYLVELLDRFPIRPALIHTTYADAIELHKYLPKALIHTKSDKLAVLEKWKKEGGVLLGSGMTTGLDLRDDLCRLNIILKGSFPNLGDVWTQKRLYATSGDGQEWFDNSVMRNFVQACGRSTRNERDYSVTVCVDRRLSGVISRNWNRLPQYFKDAVRFTEEEIKYEKTRFIHNHS